MNEIALTDPVLADDHSSGLKRNLDIREVPEVLDRDRRESSPNRHNR